MRFLVLAILVALATPFAQAQVVRPAAEFRWTDSTGTTRSSREFLGRPVVLLIANSPRQWAFRSQIGQLQQMYERLANDKLVCVAAFSQQPGVVRSNIPFVTVPDGPRVAFDFGVPEGFAIAIIAPDGNLDLISERVVPSRRVYDVLLNTYTAQRAMRRP